MHLKGTRKILDTMAWEAPSRFVFLCPKHGNDRSYLPRGGVVSFSWRDSRMFPSLLEQKQLCGGAQGNISCWPAGSSSPTLPTPKSASGVPALAPLPLSWATAQGKQVQKVFSLTHLCMESRNSSNPCSSSKFPWAHYPRQSWLHENRFGGCTLMDVHTASYQRMTPWLHCLGIHLLRTKYTT